MICHKNDLPKGVPHSRLKYPKDVEAESRALWDVDERWLKEHEVKRFRHLLEDIEDMDFVRGSGDKKEKFSTIWMRGEEFQNFLLAR